MNNYAQATGVFRAVLGALGCVVTLVTRGSPFSENGNYKTVMPLHFRHENRKYFPVFYTYPLILLFLHDCTRSHVTQV